jgi:capsular polysaccharide transport system permease protein
MPQKTLFHRFLGSSRGSIATVAIDERAHRAAAAANAHAGGTALPDVELLTLGEPGKASAAPAVVQQAALRILHERIELLGVDRSGAYQHYKLLLSRGLPIPRYEIAILDMVHRRLPELDSYHEIGSGLGTLPLMLAHDGFSAVGIERDEPRHLTAMAILRDLAVGVPKIESNCRLIGAAFPDAAADLDVSGSMAILTDFVSTHSEGDLVRLCQGLARYRYVLLDLQRFCRKREGREEQQILVEELAASGLSPFPDELDFGSEGCYRLFSTKSGEERAMTTMRPPSPDPGGQTTTGSALVDAPASEAPARIPAEEVPTWLAAPLLPPRPQRIKRRRFCGALGLSALLMIGIPTLLGSVYYGLWAADQYVTTFEFAVRSPPGETSKSKGGSAGGLLGSGGMMSPDSFVVTDFIKSDQAVAQVEHDIDLRAMFSRPIADFWARLNPQAPPEGLDRYWTSMVDAYFDIISGNIHVSVRAFTPKDSVRLADAIIKESNMMFQKMNAESQGDLVKVAEDNLKNAENRVSAARGALQAFRSEHGVLSPDTVAQSSATIVDSMRQQLGASMAQYDATLTMSPQSPLLPVLRSQIDALKRQIATADLSKPTMVARITTPEALRRYQSLDTERQLAESVYSDALQLRQAAEVAARQQQSYLALFVKPRLAHESLYPDRPRAIAIIVLVAAAAWCVSVLITYAIRDHLIH